MGASFQFLCSAEALAKLNNYCNCVIIDLLLLGIIVMVLKKNYHCYNNRDYYC